MKVGDLVRRVSVPHRPRTSSEERVVHVVVDTLGWEAVALHGEWGWTAIEELEVISEKDRM